MKIAEFYTFSAARAAVYYEKKNNTGGILMKKWFRKNSMNLFYLPALIIMLTFLVFPLANGFRLSFLKWNGYSPKTSFVGIQNYLSMLTDKNLGTAFRNTLLYGFGSTILQNILGLSAALFVNSRFKGHTAVRTFVYLPIMISSLVMGYIIYYFVQYDRGILNEILGWFGRAPVDWLADAGRARFIITIMNSWQYSGTSMVMYLAGLQSIPALYYEAADIDGASGVRAFFKITLPLLSPTVFFVLVTRVIGALQVFDLVYMVMDISNPALKKTESIVYLFYQYSFQNGNKGYGSAIVVLLLAVIMVLTVFQMIGQKKWVHYN